MTLPELQIRVAAVIALLASATAHAGGGINDPPDITLPNPPPDALPQIPVGVPSTVSDPDVGGGQMEIEIDVSTTPSGLPPAQIGTFTWPFGTNVTSDLQLGTLAQLNAALANLTFRSAPGFTGVARIVFEIDDQGNTGTGGVLSRTRFIDIDVCGEGEFGTPACLTNAAPDITLQAVNPQASAGLPANLPSVVSDVDVGGGLMEMEIDVADPNGVLPPAQVGTISWAFGTNVTSDIAVVPRASLNAALQNLTFNPTATLTGDARVVFEIDDQGNSGTGGVLSRTRFVNVDVVRAPGSTRFAGPCRRAVGEGIALLVPVRREAGTLGAASVTVVAQDVEALLGSDYSFAGSTIVSWADAEGGNKNVTVNITNDAAGEGDERFRLALQSPSGVALGTPSLIEVTIRPNLAGDLVTFTDGYENPSCP
jgi:hypothetical protein